MSVALPRITAEDIRQQRGKRPKVAVGIPMETWIGRTSFWNFGFLFKHLRSNDHLLVIERQSVPGVIRNHIIEKFLELPDDVEFLFLFDSDMTVQQDIVDLYTLYNLPIVSGWCVRKQWPYMPVPARAAGSWDRNGETMYEYRPITNIEPNSGLFECDGTGGAALCLRRDLLKAIEPPYFKNEGGGEDYYFCRKVKATSGLKPYDGPTRIMVDTHTRIGHVGEFVALPEHWAAAKDDYFTQSGETEIDLTTHEVN